MNKSILAVTAIVFAVTCTQARAEDFLLTCTPPTGSGSDTLDLDINNKRVLIDGNQLNGTVRIADRYIIFNEKGTVRGTPQPDIGDINYRIDRSTGKLTVTMSAARFEYSCEKETAPATKKF